jgi:hypothetical protein
MRDLSDDFDGVGCSWGRRISALIRLLQGGEDIVPWSEGLLAAVPQ